MSEDQLDDDAASILTVLPSYGSTPAPQPRRPNSPTPSYRTIDPSVTSQPQEATSGRGFFRRYFIRQSQRVSQPPRYDAASAASAAFAPYRAAPGRYLDVAAHVLNQAAEGSAEGTSALILAARGGDLDRVRDLLQDTGRENRVTERELYHALRIAVVKDLDAILSEILHYAGGGEDVGPPLRSLPGTAIEVDAVHSLNALLGDGTESGAKDEHGLTALHVAAASIEPSRCIKALLFHGGSGFLSALDAQGHTALHTAAARGCIANINVLLLYEADIHAIDEEGRTPLHIAVQFANFHAAELLIERGAGVVSKDKYGRTPLHQSFEPRSQYEISLPVPSEFLGSLSGHEETVFLAGRVYGTARVLISAVTSVNADTLGVNGETALHLAVKLGFPEFVDKLLLAGADTQVRDRFTLTPLHYVSQCQRPAAAKDIFCNMVRNGANPRVKNAQGKTALDMALEHVMRADPHTLSVNRQHIGQLISAMMSTQPDSAETRLFSKYATKMRQSREKYPVPRE